MNSGHKVMFNNKGCEIRNSNGQFICSATVVNNLYILDTEVEKAHLTSNEN